MCIIAGEVRQVSNTNILVAPMKTKNAQGGDRQLTVYCNSVTTKNRGAMILPFPARQVLGDETAGCEFFDLSNYTHLFHDLKDLCWPAYFTSQSSMTFSNSATPQLKVYDVGSYKASIVPHVRDFQRLNQLYRISPALIHFMQNQYPQHFSFVVCQLDVNKTYHPFGYIHDMLPNNQMFIPTMHWHQHESLDTASRVDWDHQIFIMNGVLTSTPEQFQLGGNRKPNIESYVNLRQLPADIQFPKTIQSIQVHHYRGNHDLAAVCVY